MTAIAAIKIGVSQPGSRRARGASAGSGPRRRASNAVAISSATTVTIASITTWRESTMP